MDDDTTPQVESLLPYDEWTEAALRQVVVRALSHAADHGLPGGHHFYITFRTDAPGVVIPTRLLAQYPQEMTIVLQHEFHGLKVTPEQFSVGLSFGGIPAKLVVPIEAVTGFTDPEVRFGLRFRVGEPDAPAPVEPDPVEPEVAVPEAGAAEPQVVSLDAFRRRPATRD